MFINSIKYLMTLLENSEKVITTLSNYIRYLDFTLIRFTIFDDNNCLKYTVINTSQRIDILLK